MEIKSYPTQYIAKFVKWEKEQVEVFGSTKFAYFLFFRAYDETTFDAPDATLHAFFEFYSDEPKIKFDLHKESFIWLLNACSQKDGLEKLLNEALSKDFIVFVDVAPRSEDPWIGVTKIEPLPINMDDYYASKTSSS